MNLRLLGVNHRTAPIEIRERFAIPESRIGEASLRLASQPGVSEGLVLSTCNRVELIACGDGSADLRAFIGDFFKVDPKNFEPHLYELVDKEAIRHVFRVAASLDSMVLGEPQILGQVKEAYAAARGAAALRAQLEHLLTRSFAVAKRVRTETQVGSSAVSVASVAIDLAKKIFGSLEGKTVYLIGAGKMSELAARHLIAHGARSIFVANRTHERALELAKKFKGEAIFFHDLYETTSAADIVITSTGAPHTIFRKEHGQLFLQRRKNRPMFFIDIAVPRDVAAEMNEVEGIFVYDIDDLQSVVSGHVAGRQREAERAEQIVAEEVERFMGRLETLEVVPTIISLQEQLETIRQAEIDKVRGRLGELTPEQELAVESLTRGIVNKVLHTPVNALKSAARKKAHGAGEATTLIELIRKLFNLDRHSEPSVEEEEIGAKR